MKIAELFVALGFDIKGDQQLVTIERNLVKAETATIGLLAGVGALNLALFKMMETAALAATNLEKFRSATGLNPEELQRWQLAARRAGIEGEEMMKTVTALQTAQKNVMLGQGDYSPFQFFGLSVSQNPFDQLKTLHDKIQTMDPAFARIMAQRLGISENLFQWLRRDNLELEKFNQELLLTNQQQVTLWNLNKSWQDLLFTLAALKNKFADTFADPLRAALDVLKKMAVELGKFIDWLNGTSIAANLVKTGLLFLAAGLVVVLGILTALSVILGGFIIVVKLAALGIGALVLAAAPLILTIGLIAAGLIGLVLLFNDYWVAVHGGESLLDWSESIKNINNLARAIEIVISALDRLKAIKNTINWGTISTMLGALPGGNLLPAIGRSVAGSSYHQENNTRIHVDGSGDPRAVAQEVHAGWQKTLNTASSNLRPREY